MSCPLLSSNICKKSMNYNKIDKKSQLMRLLLHHFIQFNHTDRIYTKTIFTMLYYFNNLFCCFKGSLMNKKISIVILIFIFLAVNIILFIPIYNSYLSTDKEPASVMDSDLTHKNLLKTANEIQDGETIKTSQL